MLIFSVVRGLLIPMTLFFQALKPTVGALVVARVLNILVYGLAFRSLSRLAETFGKELDFVEE